MDFINEIPTWFVLHWFASAFFGAAMVFVFIWGKWEFIGSFYAWIFTAISSFVFLFFAGKYYVKESSKEGEQ